MNPIVKYFGDIAKFVSTNVSVCKVAIVSLAAVAITSMVLCYINMKSKEQLVYIFDQGHSLVAMQAEGGVPREMEVYDHVDIFHSLFFNLAPNSESIKHNIDLALNMSDSSVKDYYEALMERNHYQRLISENVTEEIRRDSIAVDVSSYPYRATFYGKHYMNRENTLTKYSFVSTCTLINTPRSVKNTHGLIIENFRVVENKEIATVDRY